MCDFHTKEDLSDHIKTVHLKEKHICQVCGKVFFSRRAVHHKKHTNVIYVARSSPTRRNSVCTRRLIRERHLATNVANYSYTRLLMRPNVA